MGDRPALSEIEIITEGDATPELQLSCSVSVGIHEDIEKLAFLKPPNLADVIDWEIVRKKFLPFLCKPFRFVKGDPPAEG